MDFPITPEAIVAASKATGIRPVIGSWAHLDGDVKCACGLSIMVAQKIGWEKLRQFIDDNSSDGTIQEFLAVQLGLTAKQVWSFAKGFDGHEGFHSSQACDIDAYFAGLEAWSTLDFHD